MLNRIFLELTLASMAQAPQTAADFQKLPMGPDLEAARWKTLEPTSPI